MDAQGRAEDEAARDGDMSGFLDTSVLIGYITGAPLT